MRSRKAFGFEEILVVSERANHARSDLWIQDSGMGGEIPPPPPPTNSCVPRGDHCIQNLRMGTRGPLKKPELWKGQSDRQL